MFCQIVQHISAYEIGHYHDVEKTVFAQYFYKEVPKHEYIHRYAPHNDVSVNEDRIHDGGPIRL